jgi:Na+-driven multidrug efflux pump
MPALLIIALLFVFAPHYLMSIYVATDSSVDPTIAERWSEILRQGAPVLICLGIAAIGDGLQWVFRMVVVGAGDTRWTLLAMVSTAVLTLSIPVWWLLRIADPALLASWQITPLTASYVVFTVYSWLIALIMFLRFRYGPWQGMSVRQ